MAKIDIYTSMMCPFCVRAKGLLKKKGVNFNEISVDMNRGKREEMMHRANGRHTVPQIFIGGEHVGGCDDLMDLESRGALDAMLAS